ncbi:hypothetical protein BKA93DRAFT_455599 [Sparassis latifolia]
MRRQEAFGSRSELVSTVNTTISERLCESTTSAVVPSVCSRSIVSGSRFRECGRRRNEAVAEGTGSLLISYYSPKASQCSG